MHKVRLALLSIVLIAAVFGVQATTIRVIYDAGWGNRITLRGDKMPLNWGSGVNAAWTAGNIWTYSFADSVGDVQFKPLINDSSWSIGANYRVKAGTTVDIYPYFQARAGALQKIYNVWSPQLGNYRTLIVYLPPSYTLNPLKRYPVLYMHDGQNLFEAATSATGVEWRIDETANGLMNQGYMDEAIIVGVHNTGGNRIYEYTPCCDANYGGGGANLYESFIVNTLKPFIDQKYRTLTSNANTALLGSSLGGLVSFYIGRRHPEVFSKVGSMSGSFWWNHAALTQEVEASPAKVPIRVYLDVGTQNDGLAETTRMRDALMTDGYVQGADLYYYVAQGGSHNESSWAARVDLPLVYLFPWQSTK